MEAVSVSDDLKIRAAFEWRRAILIEGEPGVGKSRRAVELAAQYGEGCRVVVLNAAELHSELWESQVFGHARGAFTGALKGTLGYVQLAHDGVLIIDEVGEVPYHLQARLLRVIETGRFHRIGEPDKLLESRFVTIAATNRNLDAEVRAGRFRRDLLDRLSTCRIELAPLREMGRDAVEQAARAVLVERAASVERAAPTLTPAAGALLGGYHWPGNYRELRDVVEALITLGSATLEGVRRVMGDRPTRRLEPLAIVEQLVEASGRAITAAGFAAASGCSLSTATRRLNALIDAGLVVKTSRKRGARYAIVTSNPTPTTKGKP